jgi:16S rRNA (uracil1498-N3)-methyltransferase
MDFFYTPSRLITPPSLVIDGDEFSHLAHVMRKAVHDAITVVDGNGNLYEAVITKLDRRSALCTITTHRTRVNEPEREVILAAALLKHAGNFDFLVEKATEIGVHSIVPLRTERTIVSHAKTDRWQKLALAAMKQSKRCYLPVIAPLTTFEEFVRTADRASIRLIPHEAIDHPRLIDAVPDGTGRIVLAIGPEGGFTEDEVSMARRAEFIPVSLGIRRLRAETAAIVATAGVLLFASSPSRERYPA